MSSSDFVESSAIGEHNIRRCDKSRLVMIDNAKVLSFSPTEYKLLLPLLSGLSAKDDTLVNDALGYSIATWPRKNLEKYIDKIRSKLRPAGLDVRRVTGYGYILIAS